MSEEKITRVHLSDEQYAEQVKSVKEIETLTEQIKTISEKFVSKTVKEAYLNSVKNLEKKNELYSADRVKLTDEEKKVAKEAAKKAIAEFRSSQKKEVHEMAETSTVSDDNEISKVGKKKRH